MALCRCRCGCIPVLRLFASAMKDPGNVTSGAGGGVACGDIDHKDDDDRENESDRYSDHLEYSDDGSEHLKDNDNDSDNGELTPEAELTEETSIALEGILPEFDDVSAYSRSPFAY